MLQLTGEYNIQILICHVHGIRLQCGGGCRMPYHRFSQRTVDCYYYKQFRSLQRQISATDSRATNMAEKQKSLIKFTINPNVVLFHPTKLSHFRKKHHLKRTELAKLTGISVNALQLWELGQAEPHYSYWQKLDLLMREYDNGFEYESITQKS